MPTCAGASSSNRGYGERFGVPDERLAPLVAGLLPRSRLIAECDDILRPKPLPQDLAELRHGQILRGWPHRLTP